MNPLLISEAIPAALTQRRADSACLFGSFSHATLSGIFATTGRLGPHRISVVARNGYTTAAIRTTGASTSTQEPPTKQVAEFARIQKLG